MHATHPAAIPPASSSFFSSPSAASSAAAAAPQPAQQQQMTQLRTITPPKRPHTTGSAECGSLLPTPGTDGPATPGKGASGTWAGMLRATPEAALEASPWTLDEVWEALSNASCPC